MAFWSTTLTSGITATPRVITWDKLTGVTHGPGGGLSSSLFYNTAGNSPVYSDGITNKPFAKFDRKHTNSNVQISQRGYYRVNLNGEWKESTIDRPSTYKDAIIYESFSNIGTPSSCAKMIITVSGMTYFNFYIRSHGENNYDYVMVSQLDQDIDETTSYNDSTKVYAHTRGKSSNNTETSGYTVVNFAGLSTTSHTITIIYMKDATRDENSDCGYVLIPDIYRLYENRDHKAVLWPDVYLATKKSCRMVIANKRDSNIYISPNLARVYIKRGSTTLKTYTLWNSDSNNNISQNSTKSLTWSLDWDADWYNDSTVTMSSYLGSWSTSLKGYCGFDSISSTYLGDKTSYTFNSTVTYKKFWDSYNQIYWAIGDNGANYIPSGYVGTFTTHTNFLGQSFPS